MLSAQELVTAHGLKLQILKLVASDMSSLMTSYSPSWVTPRDALCVSANKASSVAVSKSLSKTRSSRHA